MHEALTCVYETKSLTYSKAKSRILQLWIDRIGRIFHMQQRLWNIWQSFIAVCTSPFVMKTRNGMADIFKHDYGQSTISQRTINCQATGIYGNSIVKQRASTGKGHLRPIDNQVNGHLWKFNEQSNVKQRAIKWQKRRAIKCQSRGNSIP